MSKIKSVSQYAKSKENNSKSKSIKSPGISPILKRRNAKYISSSFQRTALKLKLSKGLSVYAGLMESVLSNPNICVFPGSIRMLAQSPDSKFDFTLLNAAVTPEEYDIFYKTLTPEEYDSEKNMMVKGIYKNWYTNSNFKETCSKDIVIFPVNLITFEIEKDNSKPSTYSNTSFYFDYSHATFLLVDKKNKKAYYIDSMKGKKEEIPISKKVYTEEKLEHYICLKSEAWIYQILGLRLKVEILDTGAPQLITNDSNCLFWSMLLADTVIRYYDVSGKIKPKKIIATIRKKYDTKEKLNSLIRRYISYVKSFEEEIYPEPSKSFWEKIKENTMVFFVNLLT
jgi:hypothetical protein